ncbi:FKBP-type peptidyl-prolyl cis-trans isomerase [Cytophagales bacterium LB-30]|uniref:Peptidyl-prolyl cis-trans isomerase n=1 Tax=Shiella aurantiaca TaxID=3058365 RepID=A0ABT8F2D0_9BACT|nr:FKBP-type peptidyl-prolyl cis-trans isomerase [Shiella aurantiaca]MDN4164528.1 FKBP-type peptidyl-prolyl cis-trans isomerase [Shiella aurantiaca]
MKYLLLLSALFAFVACGGLDEVEKTQEEIFNEQIEAFETWLAERDLTDSVNVTASGLHYVILEDSVSRGAIAGDVVSVHYTGTFLDGRVFDSSEGRAPIKFTLGAGQVISGWDEGIALLSIGEKAYFLIPSRLGYGTRSVGSIPANTPLLFEVELMGIE